MFIFIFSKYLWCTDLLSVTRNTRDDRRSHLETHRLVPPRPTALYARAHHRVLWFLGGVVESDGITSLEAQPFTSLKRCKYRASEFRLVLTVLSFILLSPCAFIANNYIILPRLATHLGEERCLFIKSRIIVRLFVWSDVVTFLFQAAGGGMASAGGSIASTGETVSHHGGHRTHADIPQISLVGLIAQACSFSFFTILLIVWGIRM
jgi:hypothetical protein